MKIILMAMLITGMMTGCGVGYVVKTYGDTPVVEVKANDSEYRVFHRADIKKIMVTPTIGRAFTSGLSFYGYDPSRGDGMKMACETYLKDNGYSDCVVTRGEEVMKEQVEFTYECKHYPLTR